jgi:hypothetical protein
MFEMGCPICAEFINSLSKNYVSVISIFMVADSAYEYM